MMKIFKLTYGLMAAAALTLASCNLNEAPEFDDSEAFVAIQQTSASVTENGNELQIPVMLTSLSGIQGSVDFEISFPETNAAQEGVHYTLGNSSKTLSFTKDAPTQYIVLKVIDNETFGGDKKLTITLSNPQGVKLGANKTCGVTIEDDEHPLSFILGTMNATGLDYFSGAPESWTATFEKDADDLNKVWIYNICSGGCSPDYPVYGIVNEEKTEISIPVGQTSYATSSWDGKIEGWDGTDPDSDEMLTSGMALIGEISPDGVITIKNAFGAHAYNAGTTTSAGWFAIEMGAVFVKSK